MTKDLHALALALTFALASAGVAHTQEKAAAAPAKPPTATLPLKVQVVVSRYQGERKISSLPYTLSVNSGKNATLRIGAKVPVMMITNAASPLTGADGKPMQVGPIQYQDIGTNIDCRVSGPLDDGRFWVEITIDDSSVYGDAPSATSNTPAPGNPSFRSFRASDSMMLKDGQTSQFTTATDKVSGEITRVDVTLTVVK